LAAAGLIAVIAGCGSAAGAPGSAGLEQTRLTVAVLPATDDAPFWLALKHGHFRQDGLTVTPQLVAQSTLSVPGLLHGGVDVIGGANYVSFFQVKARGARGQAKGQARSARGEPPQRHPSPKGWDDWDDTH
jgi:NitT/TauT family transport system substrate-binding protein